MLVRRGLKLVDAKRAIEAMVEHGGATVELPTVEDVQAVASELAQAGVSASVVKARTPLPAG